jgi:hypothetical protein
LRYDALARDMEHSICVSFGFRVKTSTASSVGTMIRSIFRRPALRFTWSITGSAPYCPVQITGRLQFQDRFSSIEREYGL